MSSKTNANPRGAGRKKKGIAVNICPRLSPQAIEWLEVQPVKAAAVAELIESAAIQPKTQTQM